MHAPFHMLGEPGGPGAEVAALLVEGKRADGLVVAASLLDVGKQATEVLGP
jgi:hypothetical protein